MKGGTITYIIEYLAIDKVHQYWISGVEEYYVSRSSREYNYNKVIHISKGKEKAAIFNFLTDVIIKEYV